MASISFNDMSSKPLHEAMDIVTQLCILQSANIKCAIPNLVGDGGIGKTAAVQEMCSKYDLNLIDIHYGLKPLEEISGIPDFSTTVKVNNEDIKSTSWTLPDILSLIWKVSEKSNHQKTNIIFLDDFHISSPGNMALGYEMFTEKKLRGYDFPPHSAFILAMNQSGSKSLANPIPAPIVNRLALLKVKPDFNYWKQNYAIPNELNSKILSFLSKQQYNKFFQESKIVNTPWSSARAWSNLSMVLNQIEKNTDNKNKIDFNFILYLASSHIGSDAANEFALYYKIYSEVNSTQIFNGEVPIEIPTGMSQQYVYIIACISEFIDRYKKNIKSETDTKEIIDSKKEKQAKAINMMSNIIIKYSHDHNELAVMALKEISLTEKNLKNKKMKVFESIFLNIKENNPTAFDSIKTSIDLIGN